MFPIQFLRGPNPFFITDFFDAPDSLRNTNQYLLIVGLGIYDNLSPILAERKERELGTDLLDIIQHSIAGDI